MAEGQSMGCDIFLSYSRADRALAEQFVAAAKQRGVDVWFDENIGGGEDWRQVIVDALGSSKALVILFSDHSNASTQLIKELAIADKMNKRVIPVLIAETEPKGAYLYEMASRNWINIYPNPETRLAPLLDTLATQLGLGEKGPFDLAMTAKPARAAPSLPLSLLTPDPATPVVDHQIVEANTPVAAAPRPTSPAASLPPPASLGATLQEDAGWFPLGRYDLFVLIPVLVISFYIGAANKDPDVSSRGLGLSAIVYSIYMFVIAARNARLNRGVASAQSFAGYFAIMTIGLSPILVDADINDDRMTTSVGVIGLSLMVAVAANLLQVVLRKIFMRNTFRSKIQEPLPN